MTAYYNENDPKAAAWLRELIKQGHIAAGDVDERSIEDVTPNELVGYRQCHFFAGIGGWSYALRLVGWPDDRAVWTGSCPCQPFSAAGKGKGFADERHLWPAWFHLVRACRPELVFGEQVASAMQWVDLVQGDVEAEGYALRYCVLGAHSVGAPHIRQRLYWVAHYHHSGQRLKWSPELLDGQRSAQRDDVDGCRKAGELAHSSSAGLEVFGEQQARGQRQAAERSGSPSEPGNAGRTGSGRDPGALPRTEGGTEGGMRSQPDGPWAASGFVYCRDGKPRPVEPGTFPLAHGVPERVGLLRGYGNAIVPQVAAAFIQAAGLA